MIERRSLARRVYQFTMRRRVRYVSVLCLVASWTLVAVAAGEGVGSHDVPLYVAILGAGGLGTFGLIAGATRWIAIPAAREVLMDHINKGANAHPEMVARSEWDLKHVDLMLALAKASADLRELRASLRGGGIANEAPPGMTPR